MIILNTLFILMLNSYSIRSTENTLFPSKNISPYTDSISSHYKAMNEYPIWDQADIETNSCVYRLYSASKLVRINIYTNGVKQIIFKEVNTNNDLIVLKKETLSEHDFSYFTNLLTLSKFWTMHNMIDFPVDDGEITILECCTNGHYQYVERFIGSCTNRPFNIACRFLLDIGQFQSKGDPKYWPLLAYSAQYDQVCLKISGKDLAIRRKQWGSLRNQDDFYRMFGFPHKVNTTKKVTIWLYYLRNRGSLTVEFNKEGSKKRAFLTYSESEIQPIKSEWLQQPLGHIGVSHLSPPK